MSADSGRDEERRTDPEPPRDRGPAENPDHDHEQIPGRPAVSQENLEEQEEEEERGGVAMKLRGLIRRWFRS